MAVIDNIVLEPLGIFGYSNLELANDQAVAQAFSYAHAEFLNIAPQAEPFSYAHAEFLNIVPQAALFLSAPVVVQLGASQLLRPVLTVTTYRMRAYDTTLAVAVYWNSGSVDVGGDDYVGPGPLTGIVVVNILFS
jgi:hypothetical protein